MGCVGPHPTVDLSCIYDAPEMKLNSIKMGGWGWGWEGCTKKTLGEVGLFHSIHQVRAGKVTCAHQRDRDSAQSTAARAQSPHATPLIPPPGRANGAGRVWGRGGRGGRGAAESKAVSVGVLGFHLARLFLRVETSTTYQTSARTLFPLLER